MAQSKSYEGDGIEILFDARRCIHAAECVHNLPGVFDADRRPWIDAKAGTVDEIVQVVERCPSGALAYERTDGGPAEAPAAGAPVITVERDGPLFVRGSIEVADHDGRIVTTGPRAALCRCGASKNKPYCDNSHIEAGFSDAS